MKNEISVKMNKVDKKLVPPDGGWGWMIVISYATNMVCTTPVVQGFGLLFRDTCADLGMSGTDISIIINVNSAFGMGLGLLNGPLLRRFGCRKVAMAGAFIYTAGLTLSAWANSFAYFIITYGILCSLGTSVMNSAFSLSLNSYFLKKRGRAVGFALTLTGLGQTLAPQLISFMMSRYGVTGTVAVLGAISLHAWAAALLLQPLVWHLKEDVEVSDVEIAPNLAEDTPEDENARKHYISTSCENLEGSKRKRTLTTSSMDPEVETLAPRKRSFCYNPVGSEAGKSYRRSYSQSDSLPPIPTPTEPSKLGYKWWESAISLETVNLGSSMGIFEDDRRVRSISRDETQTPMLKTMVQTVKEEEEDGEDDKEHDNQEKEEPAKKKKSALRNALTAVVTFFDFDLLKDPIYVNIMMGMSIAVFAELNFSVLTPFILSDMSFGTDDIATVMSCVAFTDLALRGVSPFIGEWANQPPRIMYLFSLVLLVISRTGLLFADSFASVIAVGLALGVAKGIRTVYMTMTIASHVPIERLASATGLQMATNGLILIAIGPLLGIIRDKSGSYSLCIVFINMMTVLTITTWTMEMIIQKIRSMSGREGKK